MEYLIQKPHPSSLLFAIRAIGYSFETAVADIIDNSISAGAKTIKMYSEVCEETYFAFLDDGIGMNAECLKNAMLLGSNRSDKVDSETELGRFGLGLKSASFSQCRKFIVVTKQKEAINAMSFSLDDIESCGEWRTIVLEKEEYENVPEVSRLLDYESGTLVVWQDFDKIRKNTLKFEESFRKAVKTAKSHVEFVFHRFYDDVAIYFNENRVEKRDPFLLDSYGMQQEGRGVTIDIDGHKIYVTPYSLPYANSLTDEEKRLLGNPAPGHFYDEQGIYLYRNKRLIAWGGWFRVEARSELNKLARVKVDIPSTMDEVWALDVKKSSAKIPDKIRDKIRLAVKDSVSRSRGAVVGPSEREALADYKVWMRIIKKQNSVEYVINRNNPTYLALKSSLSGNDLKRFESFVSELEKYLPKHQIHVDQTADISIVNGSTQADDVESKMFDVVERVRLIENELERERVLDGLLTHENYSVLKQYRMRILEEARNGF